MRVLDPYLVNSLEMYKGLLKVSQSLRLARFYKYTLVATMCILWAVK